MAASSADPSSLEKGLTILRELAASESGLSAGQLASAAGLNRTTIYRLCDALERGGWVVRASEGDAMRFELGVAMHGLAVLVTNKYDTEARLRPVISELSQALSKTVHVGALERADLVHIARALPSSGMSVAARIGTREHAHCSGLGKALLATLPPKQVVERYPSQELPAQTARSIASRDALLEELARVRAAGYAIDDEEGTIGIKCVASPVFTSGGRALFAISVTSVPAGLAGEELTRTVDAVRGSAALLSASFGGTVPSDWGASAPA